MPRTTPQSNNRKQQTVQPEVVDPAWLLKAIGLTIVAALLCGYLTFCLLFSQGQWQLVLHPVRTTAAPQNLGGVPYQLVHFGPDDSAIPQLTGWWIPSESGGRYSQTTILFFAGPDGSLTDSIPTLASLHNLGINVFAFDYRGYGQSAPTHPSEQNMAHDVETAWQYLTVSRALSPKQIVPYGSGVGASLATRLAAAQPSIPAVILDSPHGDLLDAVLHDRRSSLVPARLLFHNRFALAEPLSALRTPKLLISGTASLDPAFRTASVPKLAVDLVTPSAALFQQSVGRFLDQYLPSAPVPQLVPPPAPSATIPH
jgi:pimeloyl-ACP methyl ester carboxylesterase